MSGVDHSALWEAAKAVAAESNASRKGQSILRPLMEAQNAQAAIDLLRSRGYTFTHEWESGKTYTYIALHGDLVAVGRWGGYLTKADVTDGLVAWLENSAPFAASTIGCGWTGPDYLESPEEHRAYLASQDEPVEVPAWVTDLLAQAQVVPQDDLDSGSVHCPECGCESFESEDGARGACIHCAVTAEDVQREQDGRGSLADFSPVVPVGGALVPLGEYAAGLARHAAETDWDDF